MVRKYRMIERFRKCWRVISKLKRTWRSEEKSDSLQCNMVGSWVDGTIVLLSDSLMFILIDWELFSETVAE